MTQDNERLNSLGEIITFTGIPRRTFYHCGYAQKLRDSGYLFHRRGAYGKTVYWSYKQLIIAWMAEFFSSPEKR
jgi:hypothetical protein